ncbi:ABC transporter ATP-binding protein [Chloroflexota bacterium]
MASQALVEIKGVSKTYSSNGGVLPAIDGLSLDLRAGEFVAVLGPSGCGKTTLMLMVAGLVKPSAGSVVIGGQTVDQPYTDLGIVFQDAVLLDWRSVLDNIMLQAEIRGLNRSSARRRASDLLRLVGLDGSQEKHPVQLSAGMRQRVSICRALLHDPPLLLMDEPFAALDALARDQLNLDIQHIWQTGQKTVLFITHSIREAVFLADRVVLMTPSPGRLAAVMDIDLPRPRSFSMQETVAFGHHLGQIRALLGSLGVLEESDMDERP